MRFAFFVLLSVTVLMSCQKEPDFTDPNPAKTDSTANPAIKLGTKGQIYFTVHALDTILQPLSQSSFNEVTLTACFDIEKDTTIWMVKDSFVLTSPPHKQGLTTTRKPYFENIVEGDGLYRIYCPQRYNRTSNSPLFNTFFLGVYFEQLNRINGAREKLIQLLPSAELAGSTQFGISNVIYDKATRHFYFGANNGFLYCVDLSGSIVWKKSGYQPLIHDNVSLSFVKVATLYSGGGKLICYTAGKNIEAYEMSTGNKLWSRKGDTNPPEEELMVTNKYVFPFSQNLGIERLDINTGLPTTSLPYSNGLVAPGPSQFIVPYDTYVNDSTIVFWSNQNAMLFVEDQPDWVGGLAANSNMNYRCKHFTAEPNLLFGWSYAGGCDALIFNCVDMQMGTQMWQWNSAAPIACTKLELYDFSLFKNDLYIVSRFAGNFGNIMQGNDKINILKVDPPTGIPLAISEAKLKSGYVTSYVYGVRFVD